MDVEKRVEEVNVLREDYFFYFRGIVYEVMVEWVKYCVGGLMKDFCYVVFYCGDCDDWYVIVYVIIFWINEKYDINVRYFFIMIMDYVFLMVYYLDEGMWEIYGWFFLIG